MDKWDCFMLSGLFICVIVLILTVGSCEKYRYDKRVLVHSYSILITGTKATTAPPESLRIVIP